MIRKVSLIKGTLTMLSTRDGMLVADESLYIYIESIVSSLQLNEQFMLIYVRYSSDDDGKTTLVRDL